MTQKLQNLFTKAFNPFNTLHVILCYSHTYCLCDIINGIFLVFFFKFKTYLKEKIVNRCCQSILQVKQIPSVARMLVKIFVLLIVVLWRYLHRHSEWLKSTLTQVENKSLAPNHLLHPELQKWEFYWKVYMSTKTCF